MNWLYSKENLNETPSIRESLTIETEKRYRVEGISFIHALSEKLGLRYITMSTACVLYHRFYMLKSFVSYPRWEIASASLFLAGKVEETPKQSIDFFNIIIKILKDIGRKNEAQNFTKDRFLAYETIIMQTLKFDLNVRQPYSYLLIFAKKLQGEKEIVNEIVQMAWSFLNDSLLLPLCVIYPPEIIALSCLYLAYTMKITQISVLIEKSEYDNDPELVRVLINSHPKEWWEQYILKITTNMYYMNNSNDIKTTNSSNDVVDSDMNYDSSIITQKLTDNAVLLNFTDLEYICMQIKTLYDESVFNIKSSSTTNNNP